MNETEFAIQREQMVRTQLETRSIHDARVLSAMRRVPRHLFVPPADRMRAYDDIALPIGEGQTISQPLMVAIMLQEANLCGTEHVLEVGLGSGYQAALLAGLAATVTAIERRPELAGRARQTLCLSGFKGVTVVIGDGSQGYAAHAPYDVIIVSAGAPAPPAALIEQLAPGGRLLAPVGDPAEQTLIVFTKNVEGIVTRSEKGRCSFVPLIGADGWPEIP